MPRLFTGLEIPADIGLELSAYRGGLPGARWSEPENYHVTLRFIGDIDDAAARDVFSVLADGRRRDPITVELDGLDTLRRLAAARAVRPRRRLARASTTCKPSRSGCCDGSAWRRRRASSRRM